jgi:hypothetical protein
VFYLRQQESGIPELHKIWRNRMHYLGRLAGVAALALSTTALSGCYMPPPPPPAAAVAPDQTLPPPPVIGMAAPYRTPAYPEPAYPPVANAAPTPLTPANPTYATPQYGSTAPVAEAPSNAGTTTVTVAPIAPPPAQVETPPPAPSPLAMWQPGHWSWNGSQYFWTSGHYVERPSPSAN